jgi:hypothetical protein
MQLVYRAALVTCLVTAPYARAQVPPDPLAQSTAAPATPTVGGMPAPYVTKQAEVEIPFTVKSGSTPQSQPTSVRIFISWDAGKSWHFYDERKPEDARFKFRARQDGEFWFATQTIDRTGRPDSPEPRTPQLRLVIDTQRPQLLVQAAADSAGEIRLSWSAADANIVATSLKLEYQDAAGNGGPWQSIESPVAPATAVQLTGQTTFQPSVSSRSINLRAEIADAAGNIAYFSQKLSLHPPKPKSSEQLAGGPPAEATATRWPTENPHVSSPSLSQVATSDATAPSGSEAVAIPNLVANPYVGPGRLASNPGAGGPAENILPPPTIIENPLAVPANTDKMPVPPQGRPSGATGVSPVPSYDTLPVEPVPAPRTPERQPQPQYPLPPDITRSPPPTYAEPMPAPQPAESVEPPTAQRPRLTNSRRFSLDYDVQTVGPEGVSAVELWGTTDGGRTWSRWGTDPDKASPFDVEVKNEAVYGFRIVVVGRNGLATSTPQPGEPADIWVGVDLTRPTARLTSAMYGQGDAAGKLDIRWEAADPNLGNRVVTLAIADRPDGPFTPIAAGLPNTGQYFWEYDPRSPRQIYLRLEVRDEAGNIGIDQLREPIKVEGLEPKGQIRGFSPLPATSSGAASPAIR